MFSRKNDYILDSWVESSERLPLILRGARQIGKSTAVRRLAERCKKTLVEVDLERFKQLDGVFATLDLGLIIQELQLVARKRINRDTILFLDEVQGAPKALAALRYFFEDRPELPVIAAGSLLEFTLADMDFSMPVGRVEFSRMYPVTFSEYLMATGAHLEWEAMVGFLSGKFSIIPPGTHDLLLKLFSEYVLIGGMPSAVASSLRQPLRADKISAAAGVHNRLSEAFRDDFAKYRKHLPVELLRTIFETLPAVAGNSKVKYSSLAPHERTEAIKRGLSAVLMASLAKKVIHTPARGAPLSSGANQDIFKLVPLDVGMSSTQALGSMKSLGLSQSIFSKWEEGNPVERNWMGKLAECAIGQSLLAQTESQDKLYYWLREGKAANAEVDYVLGFDAQIVPIEVKSGSSGSLKSLHQFVAERHLKDAIRFGLNPPEIQKINVQTIMPGGESAPANYNLHNLPLYLCDFAYEYIRARFIY